MDTYKKKLKKHAMNLPVMNLRCLDSVKIGYNKMVVGGMVSVGQSMLALPIVNLVNIRIEAYNKMAS